MFFRPWFRAFGMVSLAAVGFGCDGSSPSASVGDGGVDRPMGTGTTDGSSIFRQDGNKPVGTDALARDIAIRPPPPVNTLAKKIVGGQARLLGGGLSSCSNQVPASGNGDRWCAFSIPGASLGATELWVVNLTKSLAGSVACDGSSAECVRLSKNLWTGQPDGGPFYPLSDRFDGDTLIYHADARSGQTDLYKGPIYAWRPGWKQGRVISTQNGVTCTGHGRAEVAWCIDNITPDDVSPPQFDIIAGKISDTDSTVLPKIARITPLRASNQASQWRANFTRNGDYFAYSTGGATTTEREALFVMKTEETPNADAKKIKVGDGIARWQISNNSARWYYYRSYNYSVEGDPAGTFTTANFPMGDNETSLVPKVGAYLLLNDGMDTDRGIGLFQNVAVGKGTLKILKDPTKPDDLVTVAANIASASISRDLRYTMFAKEFDDLEGTSDAYIGKNDGSGSCTLNTALTTDSSFGAPFNASSGLTFWADRVDVALGLGEGWLANPADCTGKRKFATNVDFWFPVQDQGLIYTDEGDGETATLKYAVIANGKDWPSGGPMVVQEQVSRIFSLTLPNYDAAVYTIGGTDPARIGIYAFSAFPFGSTPPKDGGAQDTAPASDGATDSRD